MRVLYTLLLYLLVPFVLLRLLWRGIALRDYWFRWNERFGAVARPAEPVAVWVHAVSVGEAIAAVPLVERLLARFGERRVLVTTMTPTGSQRVRAAFGGRVLHSYVPYDLPGAIALFLHRMQPARVVVMETELWPNLYAALHARGVPLLIANARLSPRSFAGYSRVRGFAASTLRCASVVAAQSAADAERFRTLGAPRVEVAGNVKFDLAVPPAQVADSRNLREHLGRARRTWIAASTHEVEEAAALAAHAALLRDDPELALILVPRHPQRFDAVARLVERAGLRLMRRSALDLAGPTPRNVDAATAPQVLLGDSMGEMFTYLAAADVAFVGGSLVPVGGHNVLEPAALGVPVVFGPHMHNFLEARGLLLGAGAAVEVAGAAPDAGPDARPEGAVEAQLAATVGALLRDSGRAATMGGAGRAAVESNRGACGRIFDLVDSLPAGN